MRFILKSEAFLSTMLFHVDKIARHKQLPWSSQKGQYRRGVIYLCMYVCLDQYIGLINEYIWQAIECDVVANVASI